MDLVYDHNDTLNPIGDIMAKIATGSKQLLSDHLITLSWSGFGSNDELEIHLDGESTSLSSLQIDEKLQSFMRRINVQKDDFQIALKKVPASVKVLNFVLNTTSHGPFAWSVVGHTTDDEFQSDAITVGLNLSCYLLRLTRSGDKWEIENINIPVLAGGVAGVPMYLVTEEVRPAAQYAAFRNLAAGKKNFTALIDLTASMAPWLQANAHMICMEAVSAVAATVTRKHVPVSLNGLKTVEVEPGLTGQNFLQSEIKALVSHNLVSKPLHSLIPDMVSNLDNESVIYVISDEVPAILPKTIALLEEKKISLNLIVLGADSVIPRLQDSESIKVSAAGDVDRETPVEKILDAMAG